MADREPADLEALIASLADDKIEFLIVGGAAAVLHGAPITTFDLDVVYRQGPENLRRLAHWLERHEALARDPAGRRIKPDRKLLQAGGQVRLSTDLGPLDLLGHLHDGRGFDDLREHSERVGSAEPPIWVLDLPTLIEVKSRAGRAKDRLLLPILFALLEESEEFGGSEGA